MTVPTKDQILIAAARLFAEHGFRGTTTRAIAERAGVNEVTLFRLFGSKTALVLEALRAHGSTSVPAALPDDPVDPVAELGEWCAQKRKGLTTMRSLIRKAMSEFEENPEMPKCMAHGADATYATIREYLERCRDKGFLEADADIHSAGGMLVSALFHDAIGRELMPHQFPQPSSTAPAVYARLCLASLGFDAAAARAHGHHRARRRRAS